VTSPSVSDWVEANQRWLVSALAEQRWNLERFINTTTEGEGGEEKLPAMEWPEGFAPPAIESLSDRLGLTSFERSLLLLCAGVELESAFGELVASIQSVPGQARPTFSLALSALPDAHWSALAPDGPLRAWRLIEVERGSTLATGPLRLDERVLHHLCGVDNLDERLAGLVVPHAEAPELTGSHLARAEGLARAWCEGQTNGRRPFLQLLGRDRFLKRDLAAAVCQVLLLPLYRMSHHVLPAAASELAALTTLWNREVLLGSVALLVECDDLNTAEGSALHAVSRLVNGIKGPLFVSTRERDPIGDGPALYIDVPGPDSDEQKADWIRAVRGMAPHLADHLEPQVSTLVSQFHLRSPGIRAAVGEMLANLESRNETLPESPAESAGPLGQALWDAARSQARPRLGDLAERLQPLATWDDLVLPKAENRILRDIATQVRYRFTVNERWGFAGKSARGATIIGTRKAIQ